MKLFAIAILGPSMLCNSMLAVAAGPIPFGKLAKDAAVDPVAPASPTAYDDTTPAASQPPNSAQHAPLTTGGKVMLGFGIGLTAIGAGLFATGATCAKDSWFGSTCRGVGMGGGAGTAAAGVTLIVFGLHQRKK